MTTGGDVALERAIGFHGLSVTFGNNEVLRDVTLSVPRGQFLGIVGRSGGGKTTMLNVVAGVVEPSGGTVSVLGSLPREARPRTGMMLARDALLPWRTARRNVEYGLELRGTPRAARREASTRWLEALHLGDAGGLWPWQLSQGMRQRVALARTFALDPDLLLMDEPFAALDAQTRVKVQEEFLALWQRGDRRTVVFVTHDLTEAIALSDRVIAVGDGGIKADLMIPFERPRPVAEIAAYPGYDEIYGELRKVL
jgi:NitT/TauT family transport system ATP-binding protein